MAWLASQPANAMQNLELGALHSAHKGFSAGCCRGPRQPFAGQTELNSKARG